MGPASGTRQRALTTVRKSLLIKILLRVVNSTCSGRKSLHICESYLNHLAVKSISPRPIYPTVAIAILLLTSVTRATVVTYIDLFNTTQVITTNNATVSTTVSSAGAIGGYRTMTLNTLGGDPPEAPPATIISVSAANQRFTLSTPAEATSSFELKWGGLNGTAGLGGIDLRGGIASTNFSLTSSTVNFALRSADQSSSYTWTFTDTSSNIASYTGSLPAHSAANPAVPYAISLASFSGSGIIDWGSINFITLSGGGLELDLSLPALPNSFSVTAQPIPEPGTWAAAGLLLIAAGYIRWRRSRSAQEQESPAAA